MADKKSPPHPDDTVDEAYREKMIAVVKTLDELWNGDRRGKDRKVGFTLLVYPFNDHGGRANYMSNGADRRDIVVLFKELIARFEGQPEVSGRA